MPEPIEVFELVGASTLRGRLQDAAVRGLTRFVGREAELTAVRQALAQAGASHGQVVAVGGRPGWASPAWCTSVSTPTTRRAGGCWRVPRCPMARTPYFPVVDLLKRYVHVEDADEPRTVRARVTGQVLTLDETLQETIPALLWLLDALPDDSPFARSSPRSAASVPSRRSNVCCCARARCSRCSWSVRTCTGSMPRPRPCWTPGREPANSPPPAAGQLPPRYQHGWGSKTYYTQVRLDPLPPASADALLQALLGDDPSLAPLKRLLIERTEGNPFFLEESVRALVETGVLAGGPAPTG